MGADRVLEFPMRAEHGKQRFEDTFRKAVVEGLSRPQKSLPSKYFYDRAGSLLFEEITRLPEYYLTRSEQSIMESNIEVIAAALGEKLALIEYGSGSSQKTRLLLDHLPEGSTYVPIDISGRHLREVAASIRREYPGIRVVPVHADYTTPVELPPVSGRRVVFFPGSTIGNFEPPRATAFLQRIHRVVGENGGALIGADLKKDLSVLLPAYNDSSGVTARFNLNLLARINRDLGADFDLTGFDHRAVYEAEEGRIEMHLVSRRRQTVQVGGAMFSFAEGDYIHTENSYKYGTDQFGHIARDAGFRVEHIWTDEAEWFAVFLLHAMPQ